MKSKPSKIQLINITQFKAEALKYLDATARQGQEYIVTKRGQPIAKVIPVGASQKSIRGTLKDIAEVDDDIHQINFTDDWEVLKP